MFALGIGTNIDNSELEKIASGPENVIRVNSFKDLKDTVQRFRDGFCIGIVQFCFPKT